MNILKFAIVAVLFGVLGAFLEDMLGIPPQAFVPKWKAIIASVPRFMTGMAAYHYLLRK